MEFEQLEIKENPKMLIHCKDSGKIINLAQVKYIETILYHEYGPYYHYIKFILEKDIEVNWGFDTAEKTLETYNKIKLLYSTQI